MTRPCVNPAQDRNDYERKLRDTLSDAQRITAAERSIEYFQAEAVMPDWRLLPDPQRARAYALEMIAFYRSEIEFWSRPAAQ